MKAEFQNEFIREALQSPELADFLKEFLLLNLSFSVLGGFLAGVGAYAVVSSMDLGKSFVDLLSKKRLKKPTHS